MDHFIRIAFWIVTLTACLPAKSQPINDFKKGFIKRMIKCPSDSTFYTPSNVEDQCITAAFDCFLVELRGTVKDECEDPNGEIMQTAEILETARDDWKNANSNALKNSSECVCETWPTTTFAKFVDNMYTLLQRENTKNKM